MRPTHTFRAAAAMRSRRRRPMRHGARSRRVACDRPPAGARLRRWNAPFVLPPRSRESRTSATPGPRRTSRPRRSSSCCLASDSAVRVSEEAMPVRGEYRVSVEKDYLVFASAHFITFAGHRCEGLHGHNYRARVTVEGALNEEAWFVFDFVELKKIMRKLCDEIDHLVLLPTESSRIKVEEKGETVTVGVDGKPRYVFPRKDCALLPIPNTTVEMLAQLLATRLRGELDARGARGLTAIEMEVEENFGQSAVYRVTLNAPS